MKMVISLGVLGAVSAVWLACNSSSASAEPPSPCTYMGDGMHRCVFADAVCYKYAHGGHGSVACRFEPPSR